MPSWFVAPPWLSKAADRLWKWLLGVLIALDILLGAVACGANPGETISHAANRHLDSWGGPVCAALDVVDPGHCARVTY